MFYDFPVDYSVNIYTCNLYDFVGWCYSDEFAVMCASHNYLRNNSISIFVLANNLNRIIGICLSDGNQMLSHPFNANGSSIGTTDLYTIICQIIWKLIQKMF